MQVNQMAEPRIETHEVSVNFDKRSVLDKVSLAVRAGEIVTLIGPNGAGKSSLVRLLVGEIEPDEGIVKRSQDLRLGYVPQKLNINELIPLKVKRFLQLARGGVSPTIIEKTGIGNLLTLDMATLSGGELKRVLLAFALAQEPNFLVLDEPTAGLDQPAMIAFYQLIEALRDEFGLSILLVSHDINVVMRASDRVICLNQHICCEGAPEDVSNAPEFQTLFGATPLGFYTHQHSHEHCNHD